MFSLDVILVCAPNTFLAPSLNTASKILTCTRRLAQKVTGHYRQHVLTSSVQWLFNPPVLRNNVRHRNALHSFAASTVSSSQRRAAAKFA
jgi:hypothetical protein